MTKKLQNRPQRASLHRRDKLVAPEKAGFRRRFVNEDNIERLKSLGWELSVGNAELHAQTAGTGDLIESSSGSVIRRIVNKRVDAQAKYAYLMEIPDELYAENQAEKAEFHNEQMRQLDPKNFGSKDVYGELKQK